MRAILFFTCLLIHTLSADQVLDLEHHGKIQSPNFESHNGEHKLNLNGQTLSFRGDLKNVPDLKQVELKATYFDASPKQEELEYKDLIKQVASSVVAIHRENGLGSGFIIHPSGLVITNSHVIAESYKEDIIVKYYQKKDGILSTEIFKQIKVLAKNDRYDLALLKIDDFPERSYPFARLAWSFNVEQGDEVVAIGSPHGLERSATKGYVSVSKRTSNEQGGLFQAIYIQHTAEINPGNSGGPLFNMKGEVIGINSLKYNADGIGFSITSDCLRFFLNHLDTYKMSPRNMTSKFQYLPVPGGY